MTDLSQTIIARSDQLNSDDLIGGPRTITITKVSADPSSAEQPVTINYEGDEYKPYLPCKSMRRVLVNIWGAKGDTYAGKSLTLFRDPTVKWGGMEVGGIRISHMTGIDKAISIALTATRGNKKLFKVEPLKMDRVGDAAAEWAAAHIKSIEAANDLDAMKAAGSANPNAVKKLAKERPELHAEITAALSRCRAAFGASETATEGPADTGQDEPATDEHPATAKANQLIADAEKAATVIDLAKLVKDSAADVSAMPDDMASDVKAAFDAAEQRLKSSK